MGYYVIVNDTQILTAENLGVLARYYGEEHELPEDYEPDKYIVQNGELVLNPEFEAKQAQKERERLDALTLTPSDVERALYKAKKMDFDDLKALIAEKLPNIDLKGLAIEFRAKDFWRGAILENGTRIFDVVGMLLGYTPDDMDYLFENKELP